MEKERGMILGCQLFWLKSIFKQTVLGKDNDGTVPAANLIELPFAFESNSAHLCWFYIISYLRKLNG